MGIQILDSHTLCRRIRPLAWAGNLSHTLVTGGREYHFADYWKSAA